MASKCDFVVNGKRFRANIGDTILDAALSARVLIPHDCCTGQCDTCQVRVYAGQVDDQGTARGETVLACQATVSGEAVVEFDEVPAVVRRSGTVHSVREITADIVEAVVRLTKPLTWLPGQYLKVAFAGYPERDYSPTVPVDGTPDLNSLVLQVRRAPQGIVSSDLGRHISSGHPVRIQGPFGAAFHRRHEGRIILISSGTGFAPIWAIARASRYREPDRTMIVIAGARHASNLYMRAALAWLRQTGVEDITLTCSRQGGAADVRFGRPTAFMPRLLPSDSVYVAGAPGLVAAVELIAEAAGAACYGDAFLPAEISRPWRQRLLQLLRPRLARVQLQTGEQSRAA